jgi:site-specific DNA recombinase
MSDLTPAALYAAKSSEDKHGSIRTQLADCRKLAEREGWQVVGEFSDEGFSAYHGNRGPGLVAARQKAAEVAPSVLVAQHSDRVARGAGDAPGAAEHLVEVVAALRRQGVTLRTCQDDFFADPRIGNVMAAMMGMRNTEDSARKSEATRAGLKRRKDRGAPVGAVPLGYTVDKQVLDDGTLITSRVIDDATVRTIEHIFELIESGKTPGEIARKLNADGIRTRPTEKRPNGSTWEPRTVSKIVANTAYKGEKGYPQIIEPDRFDAIHANLARLDPAQVAKRRGGRRPRDDSYFLRGILFCAKCGGTMYTRRGAKGKRTYVCRNRRQSTGLCKAPMIPAELVESHVLRHLDTFVDSVEDWIQERLQERDSERREREVALVRQRSKLTDLDRQRDRYVAQYRKLVDEHKTTAPLALEEVERIDQQRAEQEQAIQEAEAVVGEFSGPPDVDAALDFYGQLVDLVQGRIQKAEGARELNETLSTVVAGLWAEIEDDGERLVVEFELVEPREYLPDGQPTWERRLGDALARRRPVLPPISTREHPSEPKPLAHTEPTQNHKGGLDLDVRQTGNKTLV